MGCLMAQMEIGVLVIQAIVIGVPVTFLLLTARFVQSARAFDRRFRKAYPQVADELRSHWPAYMSRLNPCPLFYFSLFESGMVPDDKLRTLRRRAIVYFAAMCAHICLVAAFLSFVGWRIDVGQQ